MVSLWVEKRFHVKMGTKYSQNKEHDGEAFSNDSGYDLNSSNAKLIAPICIFGDLGVGGFNADCRSRCPCFLYME